MPCAVVDVELSSGPCDIEVAGDYNEAFVLLRWAGRPIGRMWAKVDRGRIPAETIVQGALQHHGDMLARAALEGWLPAADSTPPADPQPTCSVVICTRDRPDDVERALEALCREAGPGVELIVVDNAPADERTAEVAARYPVRYIREPRPGLNCARMRGAREATGELVFYTDDDAVVTPGWVAAMRAPFARAEVAAVTGLVMPLELESPAQELFERHIGFARGFERREHTALSLTPVAAANVGAGASMGFRRSMLLELGLFDAELDAGTPARSGGDTYAFYLLLSQGKRVVYTPEAVSWHRHRRDFGELGRTLYGYSVGTYVYLLRCLLLHGDAQSLSAGWWWLTHHLLPQLFASLLRRPGAIPLALAWDELRGCAEVLRAYRTARQRERALTPAPSLTAPRATVTSLGPTMSAKDDGLQASVVVPTHNRSASLRRLLHALAQQTVAPTAFEVVVVADGCRDDTVEMARSLALPYKLKVLEQPAGGAAAARNRGAAVANAPLLVFLDDDMEPAPQMLAAHLAAVAADPGCVSLGYFPSSAQGQDLFTVSCRLWWDDQFAARSRPGYRFSFRDLCAGNVALPRETFLAAGGFEPEFFGKSAEDYELGLRLLEAGVRMRYTPGALSVHHDGTTETGSFRRAEADGRGHILLLRKHPALRNDLTLAHPVPGGVLRVLVWLLWHRPELAALLASAIRPLLHTASTWKLRGLWGQIYGCLHGYAYWRGVRAEVGSRAALERLLSDSARQRPDYRQIDIDLAADLPRIEALLSEQPVDGARLSYAGGTIGKIPARVGLEPLNTPHLRQQLMELFARPLFTLLGRERGIDAPADSPLAVQPISVVICTRDRPDDLRRCLASLSRLEHPCFEVIVVDNASRDGATAQVVAEFGFRYVREERPGLSWARNSGAAAARYALIAFTDDDVQVSPGWLRALAVAFGDPQIALVTGLVLPAELDTQAQWLFEAYSGMGKGFAPRAFVPAKMSARERIAVYELGVGANMALRRSALETLGGFRSELGAGTPSGGGEDLDIFQRVLGGGWTARYAPAALVWHRHRRDMPALRRQIEANGRAFGVYLISLWRANQLPRLAVARFAAGWVGGGLLMRLARRVAGRSNLPFALIWAEIAGALRSPAAYVATHRHDELLRRAGGQPAAQVQGERTA